MSDSPRKPDMSIVVDCPMCKGKFFRQHCAIDACDWWHCTSVKCQTTVSRRRQIGHMAGVKPNGVPIRIRLVFDAGKWRERVEQRDA